MAEFKKEYEYDLECDPQNNEYTVYVKVGRKKIKISEREMVKVARWEMGMTQAHFYSQICDQQAGSVFEKTYKRHEDQHHDSIFSLLEEIYTIFPDDVISAGFIARILRQRSGDGVNQAAYQISKSRVWLMHAEQSMYDPQQLINLYS